MTATQLLTGSGGWPMSVFCTPDGRPYFAGTSSPPVDRHGMPAFRRVVRALGEAWVNDRERVVAQADAVVDAVAKELRLAETLTARTRTSTETQRPTAVVRGDHSNGPRPERNSVMGRAYRVRTGHSFDPDWGGFGPAPKFPDPL